MISVIIPTLNEEKYLPALLESLAVQTVKDFEVIVVDGSSKDKTIKAAKSYQDKLKLRIISVPIPGVSLQRNTGAKDAQGEWLLFIDADTILLPYALERLQVFTLEYNPEFFTTWCRSDSEQASDALVTLFTNIIYEGFNMLKRPFSPGPLTGVKRELFKSVGGYDVDHKYNEDADFSLRVARAGAKLLILRETLYIWSLRRLRSQGTTKVINQYILSGLPILLLKKPFSYMPGYAMGGQLYVTKKRKKRFATFKKYEDQFRKFMKDYLE